LCQITIREVSKNSENIHADFKLDDQNSTNIIYYFNDIFNYFIQDIWVLINTGEKLGIIDKSNQNVESLVIKKDNGFKIIDKSGKIKYISKKDIEF